MSSYNDKTEALAFISMELLKEAESVLNADYVGAMQQTRYGAEKLIGQRLSRIGAALVALDTVSRGLR